MRALDPLRRLAASAATLAALGGIAATQTGCLEIALILAFDDEDEPDEWSDDDWDDWEDPEPPSPPEVEIVIADWPPIGPEGTITVTATSDAGIDTARFLFRNDVLHFASGQTSAVFEPTGLELGEGLGRLEVTATARDQTWTTRFVDDLLVDLTPPVAVLGPTTLAASGASLELWMGDAWVVSSARLEFAGVVVEEVLPEGYPDTLGVAWDYSLVTIPVEQLPAVTEVATLTITDAAGNQTVEQFSLSIDGAPPTASFLEPAGGATVSGTFTVVVDAFDSLPGPVVVELSVGGALLAVGAGPRATFLLDAAELGAGPLELEAVAIDEAGNRSAPAVVEVIVEHEETEEPPPDEEPPAE